MLFGIYKRMKAIAESRNHPGFVRVATKVFSRFLRIGAPAALTTSTLSVTGPLPVSSETEATLRKIVAAGQLTDLRWRNFSDYKIHVKDFYEPSDYALAWIRDGEPTPHSRSLIETLQQADRKGLYADDYDGSRWPDRLARIPFPSTRDEARFDVALTVCVMRYVSDLHIGRVNPRHFKFNLEVGRKKYDLASFLREKLPRRSTRGALTMDFRA